MKRVPRREAIRRDGNLGRVARASCGRYFAAEGEDASEQRFDGAGDRVIVQPAVTGELNRGTIVRGGGVKEELVEVEGEIIAHSRPATSRRGSTMAMCDRTHRRPMVKNHICIVASDQVVLEMTPYGLRRAQIVFRRKE